MAEKISAQAHAETGVPPLGWATLGATVGNMLEFYDFVTYSFFAIQIGHTFFPSHNQFASLMLSLATFGAGFVTRPIGALVIGTYSDRVGRRPAMILSFAMMGFAIIALALTPSYDAIGISAPVFIIIARLVQGFSLGGEVGPTTAYLMEAAATTRRGLAVSWQPASQQIAATAGALVGVVLSKLMTSEALDAYGWRIAFLLGAITLPFGLWVRAALPETLHRSETATEQAQMAAESFGLVRANARVFILGLLILSYRHHYHLRHSIHDNLRPEHVARGDRSCVCYHRCRQRRGRRCGALWRMACRPRRAVAGDGLAAACCAFTDLSNLPLDRGHA